MKQKTRDMTQGKPAGIIVSFALPLMLGNVFQQINGFIFRKSDQIAAASARAG